MGKQPARVGLGLWDRLVLFVVWVVTCGLVYVLGYYLGKGTQEGGLAFDERVARLPVTSRPPPEGQRPKTEQELTFYETLSSAGRAGDATPSERPARPATAPSTVSRPAPRREEAAKASGEAPPVEAARPERPAPPSAPPAARLLGGWTVHASPTRSREEAEALLGKLRGRGYDASIVRVLRDGDTWYRIQVGRFSSSEQAAEVVQRLREREGVSHAFVASE